MSKGPDAFRTISEAAQELDLPQHVLRFWETRFSQIKPLKRGGGRRYYRPDDIDLLRGIRYLLYGEGYTIRGVQRILKEQGLRFVIGAGKGELAGTQARPDGANHVDDDDAALSMADSDDGIVETFDPRQHRSAAVSGQGGKGQRLTGDEVQRLETTLGELLELKRLLDQSR